MAATRPHGPFGFAAHPLHAAALGEVHSRPSAPLETPRVVLRLAFLLTGDGGDLALMRTLCQRRGVAPPSDETRHMTLGWGSGSLRWERHTEFATYTFDAPAPDRFGGPVEDHPFSDGFDAPGPFISGTRVELRPASPDADRWAARLDPGSLCHSEVEGGSAHIATDFRQGSDGLTRMLVLDSGMKPEQAGALVQRLLEVETYRTLALLGLPTAQALSPIISDVEDGLRSITERMRGADPADSRALLDEISALAADLEAGAAASLYRFGASRAYGGIVADRLASLDEEPVAGAATLKGFLERRLGPALRTCEAVEERQANLSRKLSRAANLLRTRVDVELEGQNRDLLASMDRRARMQLRLQQTVEGLSVAAISYYVLGLFAYVANAVEAAQPSVDATLLKAAFVPAAVLGVWLLVRRVRRAHDD